MRENELIIKWANGVYVGSPPGGRTLQVSPVTFYWWIRRVFIFETIRLCHPVVTHSIRPLSNINKTHALNSIRIRREFEPPWGHISNFSLFQNILIAKKKYVSSQLTRFVPLDRQWAVVAFSIICLLYYHWCFKHTIGLQLLYGLALSWGSWHVFYGFLLVLKL